MLTILNYTLHSLHLTLLSSLIVSSWMSANFLSLNPSKTEFLLIGNRAQLAKANNTIVSMPNNISIHLSPLLVTLVLSLIPNSPSLSTFLHCLNLVSAIFATWGKFALLIDLPTATAIAVSLIHSKLDYCTSPFLNLPNTQLDKLQFILNSAARAITSTSKYSRVTPILKSLHWLKIKERIHYKLLSLTYSAIQFNQPLYRRSLLNIQNKIYTSLRLLSLLFAPQILLIFK